MIKSISASQAKNLMINNTSLKLIDVREPWEHKIARIENSELIPLRDLPKNPHKFDHSFSYIVYCHYGSRSFYACVYLIQQGFHDVYNLEGGIDAWNHMLIIKFQNIKEVCFRKT